MQGSAKDYIRLCKALKGRCKAIKRPSKGLHKNLSRAMEGYRGSFQGLCSRFGHDAAAKPPHHFEKKTRGVDGRNFAIMLWKMVLPKMRTRFLRMAGNKGAPPLADYPTSSWPLGL